MSHRPTVPGSRPGPPLLAPIPEALLEAPTLGAETARRAVRFDHSGTAQPEATP